MIIYFLLSIPGIALKLSVILEQYAGYCVSWDTDGAYWRLLA